jgi:hypothetical protein
MLAINQTVKTLHGCQAGAIAEQVLGSSEPLILKGLVKSWPLVKAGLHSDAEANAYLRHYYQGCPVTVSSLASEFKGRFFYNDDLSALNFSVSKARLDQVLDSILAYAQEPKPPSLYVGSTTLELCLPGLGAENNLNLEHLNPLVSIWLSNRTRVAAHYDAPENIACVVLGKRRFTLFPPEQIANLYPGPLDFTPAGTSVSMVDFAQPDFARYPRFKQALEVAQVAEMEPGDAILIPSMWWHHVESLSPLNMLINYWWRPAPAYMGQAMTALNHALLSIRDLPAHEKMAWKHLFDYYIFGDANQAAAHLPEAARGCLSEMNDIQARKLRAAILNRLNR